MLDRLRPVLRRLQRREVLIGAGFTLAVCAGLALTLAAQTWYLRSQVIDTSAFTQRVVHIAAREDVRGALTVEINGALSDELVKARIPQRGVGVPVPSKHGHPKVLITPGALHAAVDQALAGKSFNARLADGAKSFNLALFHNGLLAD